MEILLKKELEGSILDIGGGGEGVIGRLYGPRVIAIDNRQDELDEAPDGFKKILMDAAKLEYEDSSFDNVTSFYTLMYMGAAEQRKAIGEAARVLKAGGSLHIWDVEISSAYPEPFCAELDITLPGARVHTTYGIVKPDTQDAPSIREMCLAAGLSPVAARTASGHFYLHFMKGL